MAANASVDCFKKLCRENWCCVIPQLFLFCLELVHRKREKILYYVTTSRVPLAAHCRTACIPCLNILESKDL